MASIVKGFHSVNGTPVVAGKAPDVAEDIEGADDLQFSQISDNSGEFC